MYKWISALKSKRPGKSFYSKILLYLFLPVVSISLLYICSNQYLLQKYKENTKFSYANLLIMISDSIDNLFYEMFQTTILLSSSKDMMDMIFSRSALPADQYYKVNVTIEELRKFRASKQIIDSCLIYQRNGDLIISTSGTYKPENYFNSFYRYNLYEKSYWDSFHSGWGVFKVLNPTVIEKPGEKPRKIIPMVQSGLGNYKSDNLFIINIREDKIYETLKRSKLTPNSRLMILDKDGSLFSQSESTDSNVSPELLRQFVNSSGKGKPVFSTRVNGKDTFVVTHVSKNALTNKFIYVAMVPYDDLFRESLLTKAFPLVVYLLCLVTGILISFYMTRKIYNPIKALTGLFNKTGSTGSDLDELGFLNKEINDMLTSNKTLEEDLSLALPYVCEKYLLTILTNNTLYLDIEINNFLSKYGFSFPHRSFLVAIITLHSAAGVKQASPVEASADLPRELIQNFKKHFEETYFYYTIKLEMNRFCLIFNLSEEQTEQEAVGSVHNFHDTLHEQGEGVSVQIGIGKIHSSFIGMQQSYHEAVKALSLISPFSSTKIKVYRQNNEKGEYIYPIEEENKLFNFLMTGNAEKAVGLLKFIIDLNIGSNISDDSMKKLYIQLYNTGIRVLGAKSLSMQDLFKNGDGKNQSEDIGSKVNYLEADELSARVMALYNNILHLNRNATGKLDMEKLKEYIHDNYTRDIYLEQLADMYKISPKYMSKLFKDCFGIPFQQYVSNLRISKAKQLLTATRKSIDEVAADSGFNSRNTFIRMFKNFEGITPSEYRKISANRQ